MKKSLLSNFLFEVRNTGVCNARYESNHQVYTADFVEFGEHFKNYCEVASLTTFYQQHKLYGVTREDNY